MSQVGRGHGTDYSAKDYRFVTDGPRNFVLLAFPREEEEMNTAYGYARVSTFKQVEKQFSLEYQESQVFKKFESVFRDEYQWGGVFSERGVSASKHGVMSRIAGKALHEKLVEGDVIIVTRIARICRSLHDYLNMAKHWEELGVGFVCCDDKVDTTDKSPFGVFFVQMIAALAELESSMLSERIKEWYGSRYREGLPPGGWHPLLHEWGEDDKLYPFESEIKAAEMFHDMKYNQHLAIGRIAIWCWTHKYYRQKKRGKIRGPFSKEYHPDRLIPKMIELHSRRLWLEERGIDVFSREFLDATARRETPMDIHGELPPEMPQPSFRMTRPPRSRLNR